MLAGIREFFTTTLPSVLPDFVVHHPWISYFATGVAVLVLLLIIDAIFVKFGAGFLSDFDGDAFMLVIGLWPFLVLFVSIAGSIGLVGFLWSAPFALLDAVGPKSRE